jgi:hypothetical protein
VAACAEDYVEDGVRGDSSGNGWVSGWCDWDGMIQ